MSDLLKLQGVHTHIGQYHILHGVDLAIPRGQLTMLLGRNGAGKTTTLRTIMGIIRNRKGVIKLGGKDLMPVPLHRTAKYGLGFVPEERGIFATLSVEAEVRFASPEAMRAFAELSTAMMAQLAARFHDEKAEHGRVYRFMFAGIPAVMKTEDEAAAEAAGGVIG